MTRFKGLALFALVLALIGLGVVGVVSSQSLTNPPIIVSASATPPASTCTNSAVGNLYLYYQTGSLTLYHCAQASPGSLSYAWSSDSIAATTASATLTSTTITSPTITSPTISSPTITLPSIGQSTTTSPYTAFTTLNPPFNLVAPAAVTDTIAEYWSQIFIPTSTTLTGACLLNGATVTTDKHIVILANAAGTIIANSILTSVADSGASGYQCQAFTATVAVTGPQTYFVGTQPNGTTDNFYTYTAAGAPTGYLTAKTTAGTFGTLVNLTPPTSFTTAIGPLMMVY